MSMGTGTIHCKSSKQKLNTKSSTEAEVVGLSEYSPYNLWFVNFMREQGYILQSNDIFQDNQSAIRMEQNGRNSCTGNSRHIHIRYFFVKDRQDKGEIDIKYCPTHNMLADFFTKPLQGALFEKLRAVIMGHAHISTLFSSFKERVENMNRNKSNEDVNQNNDENKKSINDGNNVSHSGNESNPTSNEMKTSFADIVKGKTKGEESNNLLLTKKEKG